MKRRTVALALPALGVAAAGLWHYLKGRSGASLPSPFNLAKLRDARVTTYDVCVVGTGPAGCALALALARQNRYVLLIESGTDASQAPPAANAEGLDVYESGGALDYPVMQSRLRAPGGTSNLWAGRAPRMARTDFAENPFAPEGRWPIKYSDLDAHYAAAEAFLNVEAPIEISRDGLETQPGRSGPGSDESDLKAFIEAKTGLIIAETPASVGLSTADEPVEMARDYLPELSKLRTVDLLTGTTATSVNVDGAGRVQGVGVQSHDGIVTTVKARKYVLAAGALENVRLLLLSRSDSFPNGLANQNDQVGRYFMEHPRQTYLATANSHSRFDFSRLRQLSLRQELHRHEGLGAALVSFRGFVDDNKERFEVEIRNEMEPSASNRLMLNPSNSDRFGNPGLSVFLNFSTKDRELMVRADRMAKNLLLKLGAQGFDKQQPFAWSHHHLGGTRMSANHSKGVVDENLKVFGVDDLYVASSSVFVTAGTADPTLTIVALANRLADHLLDMVSDSAIAAQMTAAAPYPQSDLVASAAWAPADSIVRLARDSDNWPVTWGADDNLYTTYGDGHGFVPEVGKKLSMGIARVSGSPPAIAGTNIHPTNADFLGNGRNGKKGSGILMVGGVLYMWLRNADGNGRGCQLARSENLGETWQFADWEFDELGYCTFLNFGRNYSNARDAYVYTYSHNSPDAYKNANNFVLMRVPREQILNRDAYEFLSGYDGQAPQWSNEFSAREAVFKHEGRCLRSGISHNAGLGRYIWWQQNVPNGVDGRFARVGFGVYESPNPWGPWRTIYFTDAWDVGPGETGSFPSKWMSADGREMHLVFSGNDRFSVRKLTLQIAR